MICSSCRDRWSTFGLQHMGLVQTGVAERNTAVDSAIAAEQLLPVGGWHCHRK